MFQMHRLLVAGAVVAGSLWLAPSLASATTGGCLIPSAAASQYMSVTGSNIVNNLSSDLRICHNQCEMLRQGCARVADTAMKCVVASAKADENSAIRECNGLSGSSKSSCKDSAKGNLKSIFQFVRSDKSNNALPFCESSFQSCLSQCGVSED